MKHKQHHKNTTSLLLFSTLLIAAIILTACTTKESAPEQKPIGGDKDDHGCLIGAGYSWCDAKQKCLRVWEENCTASDAPPPTTPPTPEPPTSVEPQRVTCKDPRPTACTMEYNPVCADVDNGIRCIKAPCPSTDKKTYATGCTACADPKVISYVPGECPKA